MQKSARMALSKITSKRQKVEIIENGVEVMQLLTKVGSFDVDDILLNTVGGVLGFLIYMTGDLIRRRHVRNRKK